MKTYSTIKELVADGLKVGGKLYSLDYFSTGREWSKYTIKKLNSKSIALRGMEWTVSPSRINDDFYISLEDLLKNKIELHEGKLEDLEEDEVKPLRKELAYLKKRLKELSKQGAK
jgi:hypothetical protein